jgi:hypothetical protein
MITVQNAKNKIPKTQASIRVFSTAGETIFFCTSEWLPTKRFLKRFDLIFLTIVSSDHFSKSIKIGKNIGLIIHNQMGRVVFKNLNRKKSIGFQFNRSSEQMQSEISHISKTSEIDFNELDKILGDTSFLK